MPRNLDTAALRALVAVVEMGGVTRAAAQLNLTQSAVSLQIKRLEEALDQCLVERAGRGVALTVQGEQLVGYARRLLALNDEIVVRMTSADRGAELRVGVPCDLLHLHLPQVLRAFRASHPEVALTLRSEVSAVLRERCESGALDLVLATEARPARAASRSPACRWSGSARRAAGPGEAARCRSPRSPAAPSAGRRSRPWPPPASTGASPSRPRRSPSTAASPPTWRCS